MVSRLFKPLSEYLQTGFSKTFLINYLRNAQCIGSVSSYRFLSSESQSHSSPKNACTFDGHIPLEEIEISYSNSSGPGGQHVNKAKTKVEIRFHVASASWIPDLLKPVILEKEANRISKDGFLIMQSDKTRQQLLNQADCLERLRRMVRTYLAQINKPEPPADTVERHQKALLRENERRLQMKRTTSMTKAYRQKPTAYDM